MKDTFTFTITVVHISPWMCISTEKRSSLCIYRANKRQQSYSINVIFTNIPFDLCYAGISLLITSDYFEVNFYKYAPFTFHYF